MGAEITNAVKPLTAIKRTVSLRRIDKSPKRRIKAAPSSCLPDHKFRHAQQLGTDFQPALLGRLAVHFELHPAVFQDKINHSALLDKTSRITDGQSIGPLQAFKNLLQSRGLRRSNKENLASSGRLQIDPLIDLEPASVYRLVLGDVE